MLDQEDDNERYEENLRLLSGFVRKMSVTGIDHAGKREIRVGRSIREAEWERVRAAANEIFDELREDA